MSKSSSSKSSTLMSGYGEYPAVFSGSNGDDPMTRWYTQEEPWNSIAPSTNGGSSDKTKKDKKSSKDSKSSKGHNHGHKY